MEDGRLSSFLGHNSVLVILAEHFETLLQEESLFNHSWKASDLSLFASVFHLNTERFFLACAMSSTCTTVRSCRFIAGERFVFALD